MQILLCFNVFVKPYFPYPFEQLALRVAFRFFLRGARRGWMGIGRSCRRQAVRIDPGGREITDNGLGAGAKRRHDDRYRTSGQFVCLRKGASRGVPGGRTSHGTEWSKQSAVIESLPERILTCRRRGPSGTALRSFSRQDAFPSALLLHCSGAGPHQFREGAAISPSAFPAYRGRHR